MIRSIGACELYSIVQLENNDIGIVMPDTTVLVPYGRNGEYTAVLSPSERVVLLVPHITALKNYIWLMIKGGQFGR